MSLRKHKRGEGTPVTFRRVQKRNKRRLLEAVDTDWQRWDEAAKLQGLNWSEFTRRALLHRVAQVDEMVREARSGSEIGGHLLELLPGLSEKGASKNGAAARSNGAPAGRAEKAAIRTKGGR